MRQKDVSSKPLWVDSLLSGFLALLPDLEKGQARKEWEEKSWKVLVKRLATLSERELDRVLKIIVSPQEQSRIVRRAGVLKMLGGRKSYSAVGEAFWISPQTISALRKSIRENAYKSRWMRDSRKDRARRHQKEMEAILREEKRDIELLKKHQMRRMKFGRVRVRY